MSHEQRVLMGERFLTQDDFEHLPPLGNLVWLGANSGWLCSPATFAAITAKPAAGIGPIVRKLRAARTSGLKAGETVVSGIVTENPRRPPPAPRTRRESLDGLYQRAERLVTRVGDAFERHAGQLPKSVTTEITTAVLLLQEERAEVDQKLVAIDDLLGMLRALIVTFAEDPRAAQPA